MLVVKVEVWPGGDESRAREIGRMDVGNVSDLAEESDYVYRVDGGEWADGVHHQRSKGAWVLVRRVLDHWLGA